MADLPGIFLIVHPEHLNQGVHLPQAGVTDLRFARNPSMLLDGIVLERGNKFYVLKTRSGRHYPEPNKEITVELGQKTDHLLVIRGEPGKRARDTLEIIRREWKLKEPAKHRDNCPRCGTYTWFHPQHPMGFPAAAPDRHMAPCGALCKEVYTPSANVPPHHTANQCDFNTCAGGITNPYLTIREVLPGGGASRMVGKPRGEAAP